MFLLFELPKHVNLPEIVLVLIYTSYQSLLYEIFTVPVAGSFLTICPPKIESFFMGMFYFVHNISRNVGNLGGSLLTYTFGIKKDNFEKFDSLITVHILVTLIGFLVLLMAYIPEGKQENYDKGFDDTENINLQDQSKTIDGKKFIDKNVLKDISLLKHDISYEV